MMNSERYILQRVVSGGLIALWAAFAPMAGAGTSQGFDRPRGLFLLDSKVGTANGTTTLRDRNVRNFPFLDGYVLRPPWTWLEKSPGVYDFKIFDNIMAKLPANQKLAVILHGPDPVDIAETSGVQTYIDEDGIKRAVPWTPLLRERRRAFIEAMASYQIGGIPFRDHPKLYIVNPFLPGGHTGIRDPNNVKLKTLPGYTRAKLRDAILDELRILTDNFPNKFIQIGFWKVLDNQASPPAWEEIRQAVLTEFDGTNRPRVGFFMENLAASRPGPGQNPVTGYPNIDYGGALYLSRNQTWTSFQSLTSWIRPFTGDAKVANASPADGMQYAYDTYGTTYFELYTPDVENTAWHAQFLEWQEKLKPQSSAQSWVEY